MAQNEGEENKVVVVASDDGSNNNIIPIAGRQYADHPQYHHLVAALNSKKHASLTVKKGVLLLFLPSKLDDVERYWRDPVLYSEYFQHLLDDLRWNASNTSQIKKNLTMAFVSEMMTDLYVLDEWNSQLVDSRRPSRSDPSAMVKNAFKELRKVVGPILKKFGEDQAKIRQKRSKAKLQETGIRVQNTVPFNPDNLDPEDCPLCEHPYCMMVTTKEEVEAKQNQDDAEFNTKMEAYNRLTAAQKKNKAKPRRRTSRCQESACYCVKSHCRMQANGGSCPACKANGGPLLSTSGMECVCEICRCKCKVSFLISDRRMIALQMELDKRSDGNGSQPPTNTASYFNNLISTMVQNNTLVAMQENNSSVETTLKNAASLTANQIFGHTGLQSNVPLRNTMQQVVERSTTCEGGLDIRQIRSNHRAGRPLNALPGVQVTPTQSALAMTGIAREQRFLSNRLSVEQLVPPSVASKQAQSEISTLDDSSDDVQIVEGPDGDKKRKATEERPAIIKRVRKKANRTLRQELKKSEQDDLTIAKLKTTIDQLSSPNITKKTESYFVDNEDDFASSQEMVNDAMGLFH